MEEHNPQQPEHEETIVPVKPGLKAGPAAAQPRPAQAPDRNYALMGSALVVLVILALVVIFLLPRWVADEEPVEEAVQAPVQAQPPAPEIPAEELAALRAQADELLAELLTQEGRLEVESVEDWGGADWERYQTLFRAGDDAYLAEAFQNAVPAYRSALALGVTLLNRSQDIIRRALAAGNEALVAGNAELSAEQFELVLGIDPEHPQARVGLARAQSLPEVLALMEQGKARDEAGDFAGAAQAYRAALELDGDWQPARAALNDVNRRAANARFDSLISRGLSALAQEDYDDAQQLFVAALEMRSDSQDAKDGLAQADQGLKLDQIALAEARAAAFERRELWEQAIEQYRAALQSDDSLAFALEGLRRAQARADLDAKLDNLIGSPDLLFDGRVLSDAGALLSEARASAEIGPRLEEQIAELDRLVTLASTPITVELRSDAQTNVTLYRVGQLGTFMSHQVELRPGPYTAVGSRDGYRDVRVPFTVLPGRALAPVEVVCVEPI